MSFTNWLFKQTFGHGLETLGKKLINATNKEKNQIIVNNINKIKEKFYKEDKTDPFYDSVIQTSSRRTSLIHAINLIIDSNETI